MLREYDKGYVTFFNELKDKIIDSQQKAVVSVNKKLLMLYWSIGNLILNKQTEGVLEDLIIDELSKDLKIAFPSMQGFSERNLRYMRKFAEAYTDEEFVREVASKISWSHNIILMDKVSDYDKKVYYINKIIENSWDKNTLICEIELELEDCEEQNLNNTLEEDNYSEDINQDENSKSECNDDIENKPIVDNVDEDNNYIEEITSKQDISIQLTKDSYMLDFLTFLDEAEEKDLQKQFESYVTKYFLELHSGFAFVGSNYHIKIEEGDYYVGLLFYNLDIRCYVNIELKIGKFRPEYLGKLSFYLSLIDGKLKKEEDKSSIGILICKDEEKLIVQYAFKDSESSEEDTEYSLTQDIPKEFKLILPTVKKIGLGIKEKLKG
ncbi:DUF1016 domain-containing protein [Clostridium sp. P21]|uniref:DUF1016 domain-containing protein n=1 Tax=Clostridium muellerianum TaxID=2716538 RepID=A0A7Y0EH60_9CLOT|nr:PDDEXK nuclease domain-containing protein [Clostridium muellerianum]NMM63394.1 DUF1016 domain-containing protein [Clostridium muellerianum]